MRTQSIPLHNFNQMLVVSVLFHCIFLAWLAYLPKLEDPVKRVKPAFMVDLIEIPKGKVEPPAEVAQAPKPPDVIEKKAPVRQTKSVPKPVVKPVKRSAPKPSPPPVVKKKAVVKPKVIPKVVPPPPQPPKRNLVKELETVAKLESQKTASVAPQTPLLEQTVKELEALRQETLKVKSAPTPVLDIDPPVKESPVDSANDDIKKKDQEFQKLLETNQNEKAPEKAASVSDLSKELEALSELETGKSLEAIKSLSASSTQVPSESIKAQSEGDIQKLQEQLALLKEGGVEVNIDLEASESVAPSFESGIRKLKTPDPSKSSDAGKQASRTVAAYVESRNPTRPGSDVLGLYAGKIRQIVLSNWKSPLGAENNRVVAAFYIYPKGNIDRPAVVKSSGNDKLDTLAIRAIHDSKPFPEFPKELKEPNLHIIIHFDYVYQNN